MKQLWRFLLVGGSNTAVTLLLFIVLQQWLPATLAYTVVFAAGLVYTTVLTSTVVFGARLQWRTGALYVGWYLLVYLVGLSVIQVLQAVTDPSAVLTSFVVLAVTAPLNFLGGRVVFRPAPSSVPASS
ncbi:GtrA family protein [Blastococcus sp. CCUG 61487]|uniref:GtrA family protein n=1 Tax=Blastococcus sp. CCUG 61487 TaxID=1840703 RepID=UPI001135514B|nr:GtrA family protein [Blastococcus sp. CCUG 61487]TKJ35631.1 hypothetical protein A6V29_14050 [Blastococcus sp. CCUG 61487]